MTKMIYVAIQEIEANPPWARIRYPGWALSEQYGLGDDTLREASRVATEYARQRLAHGQELEASGPVWPYRDAGWRITRVPVEV